MMLSLTLISFVSGFCFFSTDHHSSLNHRIFPVAEARSYPINEYTQHEAHQEDSAMTCCQGKGVVQTITFASNKDDSQRDVLVPIFLREGLYELNSEEADGISLNRSFFPPPKGKELATVVKIE